MIVLRLGRVSRGGMHTYRAYCLLPFRIRTRIERTHRTLLPQKKFATSSGTPDPILTARSQDRTGQLMYSMFHPHTKILAGWEPPQFVIARTSWYVLPYVTQVGTRLVDMLLALTR